MAEKGRLSIDMPETVANALDDQHSVLVLVPLDRSVVDMVSQIPRSQVPDMPDRIIAATALAHGVPLITRDHLIRQSGLQTVW